jgi:hypothetical protein
LPEFAFYRNTWAGEDEMFSVSLPVTLPATILLLNLHCLSTVFNLLGAPVASHSSATIKVHALFTSAWHHKRMAFCLRMFNLIFLCTDILNPTVCALPDTNLQP